LRPDHAARIRQQQRRHHAVTAPAIGPEPVLRTIRISEARFRGADLLAGAGTKEVEQVHEGAVDVGQQGPLDGRPVVE
jgi:hypothetical protein